MKKKYIKIWGDVVNGRELLFSTLIISVITMGLYLIAPTHETLPMNFFFGLAGSVIGFIITVVIFKPKRTITKED